jgi:hypothetical protein
MEQAKAHVTKDDTIIFRVDEYRDGRISEFDGIVQSVKDAGVHVIYLSGYRSRDDFIPWFDVIAKVDRSQPIIELENAPFRRWQGGV